MKLSLFATTAAIASTVTASPLNRGAGLAQTGASGSLSANDVLVVQLATYLEHLETSLYSGGYANFTEAQYDASGLPAPFRENMNVTASQEATHATTLSGLLSANAVSPVPACTYSFPYTSPASFVALADLITTTGIGAYLGGADLIMDNPSLLTMAASILTVEARHDAYLRAGLKQSPFPKAFDTPLTATWAYNLVQAFIVSCH